MPYIGKEPTTGNFVYADDITTSSTNTYNILVGGVAFSPESANHLIVSLNGVIQKANTSFSVSGSQITFLPSSGTLSSSDSIDFILILGTVNDVGVATTVSDSAITKNKLNLISTSGSPGLEVKGDGSSENGTIQLNCSQNSHGVKISSPAHSAGQSYELILPTGNVTADKVLKVASVSGSGSTGIGQLSFGDAGGDNTPYFQITLNSYQTISANTSTKVALDNARIDTASGFDATNDRWVVPSGQAGKYQISYQVFGDSGSGSELYILEAVVKINGTATLSSIHDFRNNNGRQASISNTAILDLAVSDYVELWGTVYDTSGSPQFGGGSSGGERYKSHLTGFKLIG